MAQTGFTTGDPLSSKASGYRSWPLARKESGALNAWLRGSEVSYNGFVFPPTTKCKATIVPEYTKDRRSVKSHQVIITVEAYITQYDKAAFIASSVNGASIDSHMDNIKTRLMQPCQPLKFKLQGFGDFQVNVPGGNFWDVNYGPKPQVIEWEPMGGALCARIEWLVVTNIPACGTDGYSSGLSGVLDMSYEVSWSITDAGLLRHNISGYIELAATRLPSDSSVHAGNLVDLNSADAQFKAAMDFIRKIFPAPYGFERSEDFKLSADKKMLTFNFVNIEIPSPQAFPAGVLRMNMTESLDATWDSGFTQWSWSFSGDIEVPFSHANSDVVNNKRLAYAAFGMIVKERLQRAKDKAASVAKSEIESASGSEQLAITVIPSRISISNEMFGSAISVELSFILYCTRPLLFAVTGMFDYIRLADLTWKNWRDFIEGTQVRLPIGKSSGVGSVFPAQDMIIDLCHPVISPAQTEQPTDNPNTLGQEPESYQPEAPPKDASWLPYKNQFVFRVKHFTIAGVLLNEDAYTYRNVAKAALNNSEGDPQLVPILSPEDEGVGAPDLSTANHVLVYVTMIGQASRIGYAIDPPELESVAGIPAVKTGTDVIIPSSRHLGVREQSGGGQGTVVYTLKWKRNYVIEGLPATFLQSKSNVQGLLKVEGDPAQELHS